MYIVKEDSSLPIFNNGKKTVYWIGAHPDDITLMAGGSIQQHKELNQVAIYMSNGEATGARHALNLSQEECAQARIKESLAALNAGGIYNVCYPGEPDGAISRSAIKRLIKQIFNQTRVKSSLLFKTHSPWDDYGNYGIGGHPDHRTIATTLWELYDMGLVRDLRFYRLQHLFGKEPGGREITLSYLDRTVKRFMIDQYELDNPAAGRYAVAKESTDSALRAARYKNEYYDRP